MNEPKITNPCHQIESHRLFDLYGKATADRYLEVVSNPPKKNCGGEWQKNTLIFLATLLINLPVYSYSQDPRSCSDPRTQFPSNPPCQKITFN